MSGDYTRMSFKPRKRFSAVLEQQGRVQLDSDSNEQSDILRERLRLLSLDNFGPVGVPFLTTPDAFRLGLIPGAPPNLSIEPGRLYVDGLLAELFEGEAATYLAQPFLPDPPALPAGDSLAYLDIWEREVTYVEDPELLDVALGGADTTTRLQTVWQLRVDGVPQADCGMPVGLPPSAGRLTTAAVDPPAPDDPCILPPIQGYRGLENRLYRVEIHDGGPLGTARFKWSRDNGSLVAPVGDLVVSGAQTTLTVQRLGRDEVMRFRIGDWVTVTDDHRELHGEPGEMARIDDIIEADRRIVLDRALPTGGGRAFGAGPAAIAARHTRVQRWDQTAALNTLDSDGLIDTAAGPVKIEAGIEIGFSMDPSGTTFRAGDYWQFWARTATAEVELLTAAPPRGIEHHYVQIGAISGLGGPAPAIEDCRPGPATDEGCCTFVVRPGQSIQAAIDALPPEGGCICLKTGVHEVREPIVIDRSNVTLHGESMGSIVRGIGNYMEAVIIVASLDKFQTEEVRISSIVFQQGVRSFDPLALLMRVERVAIDDCRLESQPVRAGLGLGIIGSSDIRVSGCVFSGGDIGAICTEGSRDVTICGCDFRLREDVSFDISVAVHADSMAGPIVVEDNLVSSPVHGILVNENPADVPRSDARGSRVCGNRIRITRANDEEERAFAIDVASEASIVNDNAIDHPGGNIAGIRLCGSGSAAHGNVVRCQPAGLAAAASAGTVLTMAILAGHQQDGVYLPLERLEIADNLAEGPQHGILVGGVARSRVSGNILGDPGGMDVDGIGLVASSECIVAENIVVRHGFGIVLIGGERNTVSENRIDGGRSGVTAMIEEAPTIGGNRLTGLDEGGILVWNAAQRCNVVENRIVRCGALTPAATGISGWLIGGELHVEGNEVMDLGVSPDPNGPRSPAAYGIAGDFVLEARIESNIVTYSGPNLRPLEGEDRALLMRGSIDLGPSRMSLGAGFAIQIANNRFIGPGRTALVELFDGPFGGLDNSAQRFERVLFHGNYCAHLTLPPNALGTGGISTGQGPGPATVRLAGRHCSITGNHVRATTAGYPSYRLHDRTLGVTGEMGGPFIGNVSQAGHSGRVANPMPSPESAFNTLA